jgi:hypothetical protein
MSKKQNSRGLAIANPTIGADIEVFLRDKNTMEVVSAEGLIKGTKEEPFQWSDNPFFATSLDNIMAEFCIPPSKNSQEFLSGINTSLSYIQSLADTKNFDIFSYPAVKVNEKYLMSEQAQIFGCEPDFDAWKMGQMNPKPNAVGNLRSCGGHIHVGYDNPDMLVGINLIKAMDIFLGLPSVIQEPDNERKNLYGKAGAFRFKPYGVEYRTISNYYVSSPRLVEWAFNNTMDAIDFVNKGSVISFDEQEAITAAINQADKALAKTMIDYFGVKLAA